jgi:hypothetical protein
MKNLFLALSLLLAPLASFAEPITCEEKITLLVFFKLKAKITAKMAATEGMSPSDPLACNLMASDEFDDIEEMRREKLEMCKKERVNKETKSLSQFILDQTITSFDNSSCMEDFVDGKFSDLVRSSTDVPSARALCSAYSPIHQDIHQRAEYCTKLAAAQKDPNSCEIPDANGKCPGAPDPLPANEPPQEAQNSNALHWGKVKSKVKRR